MPLTYIDPVTTYSSATLTATEKERIRGFLGLAALSELDAPVSELTAEQRQATRYDLDLLINDIGEGTVAVVGSSDGVDYSQSRDRRDVLRRLALRFGFDVPVMTGGLFHIPVIGEYAEWCD